MSTRPPGEGRRAGGSLGGDGRPIVGEHDVFFHLVAVPSSPSLSPAALPLPPFAPTLAGAIAGGWLDAVTPVATRVSVAAVLSFRLLSAAGGDSTAAGRGPCVGVGGGAMGEGGAGAIFLSDRTG